MIELDKKGAGSAYCLAGIGADLDRLEKTNTYFVYCRIGKRSGDAIGIMIRKGFTSIYRTPGDIVAWRAAGLPLVKGAKNT